MKVDVLVIGAGPAGSAAAITLARAGVAVALVEKSAFPRAKACGEGLTPRAVSAIQDLGVPLDDSHPVDRVCVRSWFRPSESAELEFVDPRGRVLPRSQLDSRMVRAAATAGARVLERTIVRALVQENGRVEGARIQSPHGATETVEAAVTILCEGANGPLARQLPMPSVRGRQTAYAVRRYVEGVHWGPGRALEVFLPIAARHRPLVGYAWAFPLSEDSANIGIGFLSEAGKAAALTSHLDRFQETLARSDPRFASCRTAGELLGAPITIGGRERSCSSAGVLLAGDSAGLANPFWAEGISHAVESGGLAGEAAFLHLDQGLPLASYGRALVARNPTFGRISPSLPTVYRNVRHLACDLAPFLATRSDVSRAFFQMADVEPRPLSPHAERSAGESFDAAAASAGARAHRLAGRARPLFGEILARLDALPSAGPSLALPFLVAAHSATAGTGCPRTLRRGAVCLELVRLAIQCLLDLPAASSTSSGTAGRGGPWLSSTVSLHLSDGLMARAIHLCSRIPYRERQMLAEAIHGIFRLAQSEMNACASPEAGRELVWSRSLEAVGRAGARIVGLTPGDAAIRGETIARSAAPHRYRPMARDYLEALGLEEPPVTSGVGDRGFRHG